MTDRYSIARLVVLACLAERGMEELEPPFSCYEGTADIVAVDGKTTVLIQCRAKRARGQEAEPGYSKRKLNRIAMCYLASHPECTSLRFDVYEVLLESDAMASVSAVEGAFAWER